ncbi:SRPBCC family protein [Algoriphagus sp.]|uniref:SRPBCC family protein n=1 Tax=Algoriphagus sp. TaxID=1872435 RepID=UPI003F72C2BA
MDESVTWRARHFGVYQTLTSRITDFNNPIFFADEMVSGAFRSFRHEHHFIDSEGVTIMTDIFEYRSPMGILGLLADKLFLKKYMTKLLVERNSIVKEFAESGKGKELLTGKNTNGSNFKR